MTDRPDVTSRRRRNVLLCLVPWGCCVAMTIRYGYDAPYWDQSWKIPMIEKAFDGTLRFGDYWTLINEHRVFFPNLIAVPLARLTHWDLRVELALSLVFATLVFALIAMLFRRAAASISLPILSLSLASSLYGTYRADERHGASVLGRPALREGRSDDDLRCLYPEPDVSVRMREALLRHKLSIFRHE